MFTVIYLEGTVIEHRKDEIRIYVLKRFNKKIRHLIGKRVRILIIEEVEK